VLLEAWVNGARHPREHPALPITATAIAADDVAGLATRIGLEDVLAPSLAQPPDVITSGEGVGGGAP